MQRRLILGAFLAVALAGAAHGQAWPTKQTIRLISPFPPGSAVDAVARPVFDHVSRQIGQTIVFESRAGAGGTIGMAAVAKAEPDGYTLLVNSSVHTITPSTYSKLPYDTVRDFAGIVPLAQFPNVLVVPPSRFKTIQELVAAGKAKPGSLTYGSGGVGAATHLNAERFRLSAGFDGRARPLQGRAGGAAGDPRQPHRLLFRADPLRGAADREPRASRPRGVEPQAQRRAAGYPDHAGSRLSRFRLRVLDRPVRAGGDAARHHRSGSTTPPPRRSTTRPSATISGSSAPPP